jgi:hypothetical protein
MMSWRLRQVLQRVAHRVRELRLWSSLALCWSAWAIIGIVLAVAGVRSTVILSTFAGLVLCSCLACVVLALRSTRDLRRIAHRIEAAHPDLDAALLTAIDEDAPGPMRRMGFMQETVIQRALDHHNAHDWTRLVSRKSILAARISHALAFAALAAVSFAIASRVVTSPAIDDRGSGAAAAEFAEVQVTPGDTELEKGSSLLVVAHFPGAVPADAKLIVSDDAAASASHPMTRSLEDPDYAGRVESVDADLSYHIEFAGGSSPTYRVHVFENPELIRTDAKLDYPAYTSTAPKTIEDIRHVTAVEGTRLNLQFRLNKEVAAARLVDENGKEIALDPPAPSGQPVYSAAFTMANSHRYKIRLVDHEGRKNKLTAELSVNVTPNRPPRITMKQPGHDVRVSPVEELRIQAQMSDDFGLLRHGLSFTMPGNVPREVVLSDETRPRPRQVQLEHLIDFEALKAASDQLVTYFVWAEDYGPDGQPRRTEGDMYFAEVRHFEEIFRQGEQPSSASSEDEQEEQGGNARQSEQLAELQKEVINGTWKVIRREGGPQPTEKFVPDARLLRESQEAVATQAEALGARLQDATAKASLEKAMQSMKDAIRSLGEATDRASTDSLRPALVAEQVAYQALLKLRAREFEVVRNNARQRGGRGSRSSAFQRQLDQLELSNKENRFEEQTRARKPLSQKEQEERETRQVLSRLKELAQRQADLNERLKELQAALQAAKEETARQEIERQLKRLREQQQQILRDTDELQERMENEQNRERMADSRQQVQDAREHARQASEALEQGRVPQALTEGTRAGQKLNDVREELRKKSSNQFSAELTAMRNQARQLDETQDKLSEQLDAWKESARQTLRDPTDRQQIKQKLEQQGQQLDQLAEQMRRTVGEAEETEPLLAKSLFDTVRKADEQRIPEMIDQTRKLADAGFAEEASKASHLAGEGIKDLRQGVESAARSILGDETSALRLAQREVEELANQVNREIDRGIGEASGRQDPAQPPTRQDQGGDREQGRRPAGQAAPPGERDRQGRQGRQAQQEQQQGRRGPQQKEGQEPDQGDRGQQPAEQGGQPGQGTTQSPRSLRGNANEDNGSPRPDASGRPRGDEPRSGGRRQGLDWMLDQWAGDPNGPAGPITGEGFREWSDRMRDVEELLEDPGLRADAARIRDRVRGAREELKRHSRMPDWTKLKGLVADPIRELRDRIAEEVRRRESPDSRVPIDRDPVPPRFAQGVRRYYERLGSGE